jgi:DNA repair protein RadC
MIYFKDSKIKVENPAQIAKVFLDILLLEDAIDQAKEHFYVMHLNVRSQVNMVELVHLGSLTSSLVHPRETFRRAVLHGSAQIVVAHNHPSGEADPSDEDIRVTKLLMDAGRILGIQVLDHIIVAPTCFFSFKNNLVQTIHVEKPRKKGGE